VFSFLKIFRTTVDRNRRFWIGAVFGFAKTVTSQKCAEGRAPERREAVTICYLPLCLLQHYLTVRANCQTLLRNRNGLARARRKFPKKLLFSFSCSNSFLKPNELTNIINLKMILQSFSEIRTSAM
jgi:hypothetical protein